MVMRATSVVIGGCLTLLAVAGNRLQATDTAGGSTAATQCQYEIVFDSTADGSTEVWALDLESLRVRRITASADPRVSNRFPDWSPDGQQVVFVSEDEGGTGDLFLIKQDGSHRRRLTHDPARYENPAWGPNGDWIAFEKGVGENWDSWGLFLIRPDGSGLHSLEGTNLFHPSWSPEGTAIAVVTGSEEEWYGAVFSLEDGTLLRVTPEGLTVGSVKWSPDGRWIAFDGGVGEHFDLWLVDRNGHNMRRLTTSPAIDARPEWSPNGSHLVFHSTRDFDSTREDGRWEQFELYLLDVRDGAVQRLTDNRVFDAHPDWCPSESD